MIQEQLWEQLYRSMLRVRRVEEKIIDVYWSDKIKSPVHLSIGQEAVATGVCEALEPEDILLLCSDGLTRLVPLGHQLRLMSLDEP